MSAQGRNGNAENRSAFDFYPTDARYVRAVLLAIDGGGRFGFGESEYRCPCAVCSAGKLEPLPGGIWCDPAAGDLAIVRAVDDFYHPGRGRRGIGPEDWITVDIRPETPADIHADFVRTETAIGADVYITNPPYGTDSGEEEDAGDEANKEKRRAAILARTLGVRCERCGSEPAVPCVGKRGPLKVPHVERHRAAKELADSLASNAFNFVRLQVERMSPGGSVLNLIRFGFFTSRNRRKWNQDHPADIWPLSPRPSFREDGATDATEYVWARWGRGATGAHHAALDWRTV